eukprot:g1485.t1
MNAIVPSSKDTPTMTPSEVDKEIDRQIRLVSLKVASGVTKRMANGLSAFPMRKVSGNISEEENPLEDEDIDASLLFSMERTLWGALNQAWTLMFVGIGLMCVGALNETVPDTLGAVIMVIAILFTALSYGMHVRRINELKKNRGVKSIESIFYTGFFVVALIFGFIAEIYFAGLFPYLKRSKVVEVATSGGANSTAAI